MKCRLGNYLVATQGVREWMWGGDIVHGVRCWLGLVGSPMLGSYVSAT
ncbi:hypothetical protein VU04_10320 [Desulfobulbus sp. TB]|nr:hypothetical protein [Desulfobulbus sp. TB]